LRRIGGEAEAVDANAFAFAAIAISIVVDIVRWRTLTIVAARTGSDALAADALHFSSDLVASVLVLAGLAATRFGLPHADALAAVGVSLFIGVAGFRLGRRTVDALVDTAPKGLAEPLRLAVEQVPGVAGTDYIRLRRAGAKVVGDLGLQVSRTLPLERVATLKADVAAAIQASQPNVEVTVIANPVALDDETLLERILLVASRRRLFVHHFGVQNVGGRKSVTLDLEVDGRMRLVDAHEIATQLEAAIAADLGVEIEVETHIEPMDIHELDGEAAEPVMVEQIATALSQTAARGGALSEVHNVRVRVGPAGFYVIFHCRADPNLTVAATHDEVDALERALRNRFADVIRIVGHAEPAR
jgi:divalent metal cation (Fe/Co/Zn/Cd) transporter